MLEIKFSNLVACLRKLETIHPAIENFVFSIIC